MRACVGKGSGRLDSRHWSWRLRERDCGRSVDPAALLHTSVVSNLRSPRTRTLAPTTRARAEGARGRHPLRAPPRARGSTPPPAHARPSPRHQQARHRGSRRHERRRGKRRQRRRAAERGAHAAGGGGAAHRGGVECHRLRHAARGVGGGERAREPCAQGRACARACAAPPAAAPPQPCWQPWGVALRATTRARLAARSSPAADWSCTLRPSAARRATMRVRSGARLCAALSTPARPCVPLWSRVALWYRGGGQAAREPVWRKGGLLHVGGL